MAGIIKLKVPRSTGDSPQPFVNALFKVKIVFKFSQYRVEDRIKSNVRIFIILHHSYTQNLFSAIQWSDKSRSGFPFYRFSFILDVIFYHGLPLHHPLRFCNSLVIER